MLGNGGNFSTTRRELLQRIGMTAGAAMMYQAMSHARARAGVGLSRTDRPQRRTARHIGADPRRGHGRTRCGLRTAARRLQGQGARIQPSRGRPRVDAARRRRIHRTRRRETEVRVRPGPVHQSRSLAHSVSPLRDARLREAPEGAARAVQPDQLQCLPAFADGLRRQAAAPAPCAHGFPRPRRRAARQGRQQGPARCGTDAPRTRKSCSSRCAAGACSTRITATPLRQQTSDVAATTSTRAAA